MPNLRGHSIDSLGISVTGSDGRTLTLTYVQIRADYLARTGSASARKSATTAWSKQQVTNAIGSENVPDTLIDFDHDPATGSVTVLGFHS